MAALDYNAVLYAATWAAVFASATLATHCPVGRRIDERTDGGPRQAHHRGAADYLEIALKTIGGAGADTQGQTITPTFGQGRDPNADAIMPITAELELGITYDPKRWAAQTSNAAPPEVLAHGQLMVNYPRLGGIEWIRAITFARARRAGTEGRKIVTDRIRFDCRIHAAQLRN